MKEICDICNKKFRSIPFKQWLANMIVEWGLGIKFEKWCSPDCAKVAHPELLKK